MCNNDMCVKNSFTKEEEENVKKEIKMSNPSTGTSSKIEDCWGCRIVGGGTFIGVSMYLWKSQKRNSSVVDRRVAATLSMVAFTCGVLRLSLSQDRLYRLWSSSSSS